jgi:phenylalanyl-tRNA synthetase beta chain
MKISVDWLKDYIELPESPQKLQEDLTMAGLVVEGISPFNGDTVLEVEVTANRPDCLNHVGVARELAALYGRSLRLPPARPRMRLRAEKIAYSIEIRDPQLCPRYSGLVLDGIRVESSPAWMQKRLEACGMRPINSIVDITNYVLLEVGHPLHAFDFDLLSGGRIVVSRAEDGQKIVTLDGMERLLDAEMLLINDGAGPVAIAGVMGGLHSEISLKTERVLLECAYFSPRSIRRTSKRLGLSTEASYRFERGVDWDGTVAAIGRTAQLIRDHAGGRLAGSLQDVHPGTLEPVRIELSRQRAVNLLGVSLEDAFVEATLKRLNFSVQRKGKGHWLVTCPTYRADMELEADLIEELARFFGYQNIPTTMPAARDAGTPSTLFPHETAARRSLMGLGYSEAVHLSFAGGREVAQFPVPGVDAPEIRNPLTEETQFLRTTLAPGLVASVKRNLNHDTFRVRLFEIGKIFRKNADGLTVERRALGMVGTGGFTEFNWHHPSEEYDFFHLKGAVTAMLSALRSEDFIVVPGVAWPWLNPADSASLVVGGQQVGVLGSLHPMLQDEYKLRQAVYIAEIDFEALCPRLFSPVRYEPMPRYPRVERDLCVVLDRSVRYEDIRTGILGLGIGQLTEIDLIDVYEGAGIPSDKVSITLRLIFLDRERTLTIDRIQSFGDNVLAFLQNSLGAQLR